METTDRRRIMIVDLQGSKIGVILRHLKRKKLDLSCVWCYSYKVNRKIIHTLVLPYKYGYKLTKPTRKLIQPFDDPIVKVNTKFHSINKQK